MIETDGASALHDQVTEAPYVWDLATDALHWSGDAAAVLRVPDPALLATGRAFAALHDDVEDCEVPPAGRLAALPYRTRYRFHPRPGENLLVEDCGCIERDAAGVPLRARGAVRVIA